ncbi:MAG: mechanosensitive ion channel [Lysobacterales bacterium]|jgi:small-conductance mechanosensitive channel
MDFETFWNFTLVSFSEGSKLTVGMLVLALVALLLGFLLSAWISRLVGKRLARLKLGRDNVAVLQKLTFLFLLIITIIIVLSMLNVPVTALTFISGALAVGIGFGAQNVINNFISGWILMSERPVRIDDFIEIDDSRGIVEHIGNRSTRIKRIDGVHIMVPNSLLMERTLINWTLVDRNIRTSVMVGVAYGSPVREVERLINQAIAENGDILKTPEPLVVFNEFGDSALEFEALFWCRILGGEKELRMVRSELRFRIDDLFRENGITIAFPQRDVHLIPSAPVEIRMGNDDK